MQLDLSDDFLLWDNTSMVRYEVARAVPSVADVSPLFDGRSPAPATPKSRNKSILVPIAKRRNLTMRELAASGGVYQSSDQVYLIPDALLSPSQVRPKMGDVVIETDDDSPGRQPGQRWTVLDVSRGKSRQTHRLACRNLALALDLRETVTIERPAIRYDAAGVPVKAFPSDATNPGGVTLYSQLPGRAQLVTKEMADEHGIRGLEGKYEVFVDREVDVTHEDRLLLANGLYLDIVGYRNGQRIDELPVIVCERKV